MVCLQMDGRQVSLLGDPADQYFKHFLFLQHGDLGTSRWYHGHTCFYQYVIPALERLSKRKISLQKMNLPLSKPFHKSAGLTHFLKGYYNGKTATALDAQESYRLSSFAKANCLIEIPEQTTSLNEGELVDVYLLPQ